MQEFRVVQCCECKVLQVDIVKKAKKWACKACNQNQVVKRIYFKSYAAKECREECQKLNFRYQQSKIAFEEAELEQSEHLDEIDYPLLPSVTKPTNASIQESDTNLVTTSKWLKFVKEPLTNSDRLQPDDTFSSNFKRPSTNENLSTNNQPSSSTFSSYHQHKSSLLPQLVFRPKYSAISKICSSSEPSSKKIKVSDDFQDDGEEFLLTQEELDFLDALK